MGPIHTRAGRDELLEQIEDGVSSGGELLIGGGTGASDKGWFLEPAVIAEPAEASRLMTEEVFGPVLPVFRFTDFDDAIARANDTPYGLGSSIWTHDARLIHRAAQEIESGMTWVNQIHYGYDELPFGGVKASGFGKEHGIEALDSYVEIKSVVVGGLVLMAVTFTAAGPLGFITLDHPPANSYDLAFMTEFSNAVDEALAGDTRVVIVQSANPKFFSAGADIKRFLEGDVEANMEMIRVSQAAFRRMAAAPAGVHRAPRRPRARRWPRDRAGLRHPPRRRRLATSSGLPEVTLGLLPGNGGTQRLTRLIGPSARSSCCSPAGRYGVEEAREMGLVADVYDADEAEDKVREYAERLAARPGAGDRRDQALRARGRPADARRRARARGRADGDSCSAPRTPPRGCNAFVEKRTPEFVGA